MTNRQKQVFVITWGSKLTPNEMERLRDAMMSNYISKKIQENVYLLMAEANEIAKTIFDRITNEAGVSSTVLVFRVDNFFGNISTATLDWVIQHEPGFQKIDDKDSQE